MKIYLNPYKCLYKSVAKKDEAFLHSIGIPYDELWEDTEVAPILNLMYGTTERCIGKFDLFNKWALHNCRATDSKGIKDALRRVYLKPNRQCTRCKVFTKCCDIHLTLEELHVIWSEVYSTKAEFFKP